MKIGHFVTAFALLAMLVPGGAHAQTRKDTKAYKAAVAKNDVASLQKYLKKFPQGYYTEDVYNRLDSIDYHSVDASVASLLQFLAEKPQTRYKSEILERVMASKRYAANPELTDFVLIDPLREITIDNEPYWYYAYENRGGEAAVRREYVANLINPREGTHTSAMFEGKLYAAGDGYRIEGSSPDVINLSILPTKELKYLLSHFDEVPYLVKLSEADQDAEKCFDLWLEKNAKVTKGSKVEFITIPSDCTLVATAKKNKAEDRKDAMTVYMLDWKGYTTLILYNSKADSYRIIWAEPVCRNKKTDKYLTSVYFESSAQLALYYYHGRKAIKEHLNLSNGRLQ